MRPLAPEDRRWMRVALEEARVAGTAGEVPVGAVLVVDESVVARAHNRTISERDPSAHAEVVALREAGRCLGYHRTGGTLYVTLEPCLMCMGAMVQARIDRLVFGARDPKAGAAVSLYRIGEDPRLNHRFAVVGGVLSAAAGALLTEFFSDLRTRRLRERSSLD